VDPAGASASPPPMDSTLGSAGRIGSGGGSGGLDNTNALGGGGASTAAWTRLVSSRVEDEHVGVAGAGGGRAGGLPPPQGHFLDACFLCRKPLASNRDIFMYRFARLLPFVWSVHPARVVWGLWVRWGPGYGHFPASLEGVFPCEERERKLSAESTEGKVIVGNYFPRCFFFVLFSSREEKHEVTDATSFSFSARLRRGAEVLSYV
jgi:hypothetical protein